MSTVAPRIRRCPTRLAAILLVAAVLARPAAAGPLDGLPLGFEPNLGQLDPEVAFLARGPGYGVHLGASEAVLVLVRAGRSPRLPPAVVRMRWLGALPPEEPEGTEPLPGASHYLVGNDPRGWRTGVPRFARVVQRSVWPGVDLVFRGDGGALEYDLVVAPGADPARARFGFEGVRALRVEPSGDLVLELEAGGELVQQAPRSWQEGDGRAEPLTSRWVVHDGCEVGFAVDGRDPDLALVIDPVLAYSTYLGGSGPGEAETRASAIAVDAAGSAYVAGTTASGSLATAGAFQTAPGGDLDAFVVKVDAAASTVVYATYLGGSELDAADGIAVDAAGHAIVTGGTFSSDFPVRGAVQPAAGGDAEAFVARLDPSGASLAWSTYLGGSGSDWGHGIAIDGAGGACIAGETASLDFPTRNALQPAPGGSLDAFAARIDPSGATLAWSTYLGGASNDFAEGIAVDATGSVVLAGQTASTDFPIANALQGTPGGGSDAFVARLTPPGTGLAWSTYLGGSGADGARGVALGPGGTVAVAGATRSPDFPVAAPLQPALAGPGDAFVARIDSAGRLLHSTYLGGSGHDEARAIAVDPSGAALVAGFTGSADFPVAGGGRPPAGGGDAFALRLDAAGSTLLWSTGLGGSGGDGGSAIASDASGNAWIAGDTDSTDFPLVAPFQPIRSGIDAFLAKVDPGGAIRASSYLGGAAHHDRGFGIAVDPAGAAYVTGVTSAPGFPAAGGLPGGRAGGVDAFVAKLAPSGAALEFATYLGGRDDDEAYIVAVDASGAAYLTGYTWSTDFPVAGAVQPVAGGDREAFVTKLSPSGSALVWSTYLGGAGSDEGSWVAVDGAGRACVTGRTGSAGFPLVNAVQTRLSGIGDAFVTCYDAAGAALELSTYLGGSGDEWGFGIALDAADGVHVAGWTWSADFPTVAPVQASYGGARDGFVAELRRPGSLVHATYLGGSSRDGATGIAVDPAGGAWVTGSTESADFPVVAALQPALAGPGDAFVARLPPGGGALSWSTYLGGSGEEDAWAIAADPAGGVVVGGVTGSVDFPTTSAFQAALAGGSDGFVARLTPGGAGLAHATYLGGSGLDEVWSVALDPAGDAYLTGLTQSLDFPVAGALRSTAAGDEDAFVAKLAGCRPLPGRLVRLLAVKASADVRLAWPAEPLAAGYRARVVDAKREVATANVSRAPLCEVPAAVSSCTHAGGIAAPPAARFYQVTALCSDGVTEGPL